MHSHPLTQRPIIETRAPSTCSPLPDYPAHVWEGALTTCSDSPRLTCDAARAPLRAHPGCPAFLTADACVTTALCALITMSSLLPVQGLIGAAGFTSGVSTRMPALPTSIRGVSASATYDDGLKLHDEAFALGVISATLCLASCKLGLFTLCVWPSRVGNAPVGVSVNPHAIEPHDGSTALHHAVRVRPISESKAITHTNCLCPPTLTPPSFDLT